MPEQQDADPPRAHQGQAERPEADSSAAEFRIGLNDVLRFLLELFALFSLGYWGYLAWPFPWPGILFMLGTPLFAAVVWGLFRSPKALFPLDPVGRALIEILVMGSAAGAWLMLDYPLVGAVFGAVAAISGIINGRADIQGASTMTILFHSARKLDAAGQIDDFWMLVDGDRIVQTGSGPAEPTEVWAGAAERIDVGGHWLVPGFIDLHTHGGGGFSYDEGSESIAGALAAHRAHGTTRTVLSLVASPLAQLRSSLGIIADLVASDPLVLGSHLEGPFLAEARRGAHNPDYLQEPQPYELEELLGAGRGTIRQITMAPELPGAMEAIDVLVEQGIIVAVGHTEASFELAQEAFDRGARLLTHTFNAMPGIHHRKPGPVIAAFEDKRIILELILDGLHVHPDVAAMAFAAAPGRIALVTDAMAAAAFSDGDYRLSSLNVTVKDGLAVLSGTDTIAGSTLTQDRALRIGIEKAKLTPSHAVEALTLTPARALGLEHEFGYLKPGYVADAVLLDHDWQVTSVWGAGRKLH